MDKEDGLPAGQLALKEALRDLEGRYKNRARGRGARRTRKAVLDEVNGVRGASGLRPLSEQTVSDWFTKGTAANDLRDLLDMVAAMSSTTPGTPLPPTAADVWKRLWTAARPTRRGLDEEVQGYLAAARRAAQEHPYPGIPGRADMPSVADVYVRQYQRPTLHSGHAALQDRPAGPTAAPGSGEVMLELADAVFHKADLLSVLIAAPGGGKSTLLRRQLHHAATEWLDRAEPSGRASRAVPVWISARGLVGQEQHIPDALAAATGRLARYGRNPRLAASRFLRQPCSGGYWQLLVDDLDELPDADQRREVLQKLANAVAEEPPLYRCVVATRPLTANELDVLEGAPRYELQPFTIDDLNTYVERFFSNCWPMKEAGERARRFSGALRDAALTDLARTPLMAFMLCQLYLSAPERALPRDRNAVYQEFTDLLYENNQSKRVSDSHEQAIANLVERLQSPGAREQARTAARRVHEHLSELIDHTAHQWLDGRQTSVAEAFSSHHSVRRPDKVRREFWERFLEDLVLPTGLLVHQADGLGFPHKTFLEFHAARHATRDEQACAETLDQLFPLGVTRQVPDAEPSYLGFLLDGLLRAPVGIAKETADRIDAVARRRTPMALLFLVQQVKFRTGLPSARTSAHLTRFAEDDELDYPYRLEAAACIAGMEGFREAGGILLKAVTNSAANYRHMIEAAELLAGMEGHQEEATARLIAIADDERAAGGFRVEAAELLVGLDGRRAEGTTRLVSLAGSEQLDGSGRLEAAELLAAMADFQEQGAVLLAAIAGTRSVDGSDRVAAARALARLDGRQEEAAARLAGLGAETLVHGSDRVAAVRALSRMAGHEAEAVAGLADLVADPGMNGSARVDAARILSDMSRLGEPAAAQLKLLSADSDQDGSTRVDAVRVLAGLSSYEEVVAARLTDLIRSSDLRFDDRLDAAWILAGIKGCAAGAVRQMVGLVADPTLQDSDRFDVARVLAAVVGHEEEKAAQLVTLIGMSEVEGHVRVVAAQILAELEGREEAGAAQLVALTVEPTLSAGDRVNAAMPWPGWADTRTRQLLGCSP